MLWVPNPEPSNAGRPLSKGRWPVPSRGSRPGGRARAEPGQLLLGRERAVPALPVGTQMPASGRPAPSCRRASDEVREQAPHEGPPATLGHAGRTGGPSPRRGDPHTTGVSWGATPTHSRVMALNKAMKEAGCPPLGADRGRVQSPEPAPPNHFCHSQLAATA